MKKRFATQLGAAACALALGLSVTGCSAVGGIANTAATQNTNQQASATANTNSTEAGTNQTTDEKTANKTFMSQVNQCMTTLQTQLSSMQDAVSRKDVAGCKACLKQAQETVAALEKLEAPDALKDIKAAYVEGTKGLQDALSSYITLFSKVKKGEDATFDADLAKVQTAYDAAIAKLKEADEAAAKLP